MINVKDSGGFFAWSGEPIGYWLWLYGVAKRCYCCRRDIGDWIIDKSNMADRTGLEPATSGVTGRHSNQLNYRSVLLCVLLYRLILIKYISDTVENNGIPKGVRTPVTAVKGRCPRPLDDGDTSSLKQCLSQVARIISRIPLNVNPNIKKTPSQT